MSEELNNRNEISSSQNKDTQNQNTQSQSSGTTYSWVNPKVHQQSGSQGSANPWGSGSTWSGQGTGGQNGGRGGEKQQYYYSTGTAGTQTAAGHGKAGKVKAKKTRQPMGTGKKWAMTVAMALVFGVVAGGTMYGVNEAAGYLNGETKVAAVPTTQPVAPDGYEHGQQRPGDFLRHRNGEGGCGQRHAVAGDNLHHVRGGDAELLRRHAAV